MDAGNNNNSSNLYTPDLSHTYQQVNDTYQLSSVGSPTPYQSNAGTANSNRGYGAPAATGNTAAAALTMFRSLSGSDAPSPRPTAQQPSSLAGNRFLPPGTQFKSMPGLGDEESEPPAKKAKQSGNTTGRKSGAVNYSVEDTCKIAEIVVAVGATNSRAWDLAAIQYNEWAQANERPTRTGASLKEKFNRTVQLPMPTGDPACPPDVKACKRALFDVQNRVASNELDDNEDETGLQAEQQQYNATLADRASLAPSEGGFPSRSSQSSSSRGKKSVLRELQELQAKGGEEDFVRDYWQTALDKSNENLRKTNKKLAKAQARVAMLKRDKRKLKRKLKKDKDKGKDKEKDSSSSSSGIDSDSSDSDV